MSEYKVPQDVEADDKLLGPFSFRQFIYLGIALGSCAIAWALAQLFILLAIIPVPFILLFGALALPLRKDQPMEIYLAAIVSFYLKPRKRLWVPDGIESLIEITVPKTVEHTYTKQFDQAEAARRLRYLSNIVDSKGWAVRGESSSPLTDEVAFEAANTPDYMADTAGLAQNFDKKLAETEAHKKAKIMAQMRQPAATPPEPQIAPIQDPYAHLDYTQPQTPVISPYPTQMQQTVIQPIDKNAPTPARVDSTSAPIAPNLQQNLPKQLQEAPLQPQASSAPAVPPNTANAKNTSENKPSAAIIDLASNHNDVSVETLARMAKEAKAKEKAVATFESVDDEAFVSFR